jgi:hypothetical protein
MVKSLAIRKRAESQGATWARKDLFEEIVWLHLQTLQNRICAIWLHKPRGIALAD